MENKLKAFRLPKSISMRLKKLAARTHRTETFYVIDALKNYFDDYEDALMAYDRKENPQTEYITSKELRDRLGL